MTRDVGLERLLEGLPREAAPEIAVESLFRRLFWRRLAAAAAAVLLLGGGAAAFLFTRGEPPAPVHLRIRVVEPPAAPEPPSQGPAELNLP